MTKKYNLDFKLKEKNLEKELSIKIQEQNKSKFQELRSQIEEAEEEKKNIEKKMSSKLKQKEQALEKSSKENEAKMVANLKLKEKEFVITNNNTIEPNKMLTTWFPISTAKKDEKSKKIIIDVTKYL